MHGYTYRGGRSVSHASWLKEHAITLKFKKNELLLISHKPETVLNARLGVIEMTPHFTAEGENPMDCSADIHCRVYTGTLTADSPHTGTLTTEITHGTLTAEITHGTLTAETTHGDTHRRSQRGDSPQRSHTGHSPQRSHTWGHSQLTVHTWGHSPQRSHTRDTHHREPSQRFTCCVAMAHEAVRPDLAFSDT